MGALQVRHEPACSSVVRTHLRAELGERGVQADSIDTVLLVTSELVSNAVRHSPPTQRGTLDVAWKYDADSVTVRVTDGSTRLPRRRRARPDDPHGRGLAIVECFADSWGAESLGAGKYVWARVAVVRDAARTAQMA